MVEHVDAQDPEIHEPKGVSSATSGDVYVADGLGSGAWTDYNTWTDLPQFGGLVLNDSASGVAVTTIGTTAQKLAVFTATTPNRGLTANATTDIISVSDTGDYKVDFNICFATAAAGDAGDYQFKLRVNDAEPSSPYNIGATRQLTGTADRACVSFSGIISLTAADEVSVWVESDEAGDTDDINVFEAQLIMSLIRVTA